MNGRGGLLSAGGILSIIVGVFELIVGGVMVALKWVSIPFPLPSFPGFGDIFSIGIVTTSTWLIIIGAVLAVLGIIAIIGGASAIRRSSFGLSLAGAICALLPINVLGILAVIFVSLAKGEFGAEY